MNYKNNNKSKEINLKELFLVIKKRIWVVIVITIITTGLGVYLSNSNNTPQYQSSARIIIEAEPELRNTLQVIMKDSTVLGKVVISLNLDQSPEALAEQITVSSIDDSQVVSINVTDTNPKRSADIANTTAKVFKEEIPKIMDFTKVRLLSDAKVNPLPINQSNNRLIIIGFIIGLIIGIGTVFLLDSLDETLNTNREIEDLLGLPVLGRVSKFSTKNLKKNYVKNFRVEARGETIGYK